MGRPHAGHPADRRLLPAAWPRPPPAGRPGSRGGPGGGSPCPVRPGFVRGLPKLTLEVIAGICQYLGGWPGWGASWPAWRTSSTTSDSRGYRQSGWEAIFYPAGIGHSLTPMVGAEVRGPHPAVCVRVEVAAGRDERELNSRRPPRLRRVAGGCGDGSSSSRSRLTSRAKAVRVSYDFGRSNSQAAKQWVCK